jgi:hypothetical protein
MQKFIIEGSENHMTELCQGHPVHAAQSISITCLLFMSTTMPNYSMDNMLPGRQNKPLKKIKACILVHIYNPSMGESQGRRIMVLRLAVVTD